MVVNGLLDARVPNGNGFGIRFAEALEDGPSAQAAHANEGEQAPNEMGTEYVADNVAFDGGLVGDASWNDVPVQVQEVDE